MSTPLFLTRANLEGVLSEGGTTSRCLPGGYGSLVGEGAQARHCLEGEWKSTGDEHRRSHTAPAAQHIFRCGSCLVGYLPNCQRIQYIHGTRALVSIGEVSRIFLTKVWVEC